MPTSSLYDSTRAVLATRLPDVDLRTSQLDTLALVVVGVTNKRVGPTGQDCACDAARYLAPLDTRLQVCWHPNSRTKQYDWTPGLPDILAQPQPGLKERPVVLLWSIEFRTPEDSESKSTTSGNRPSKPWHTVDLPAPLAPEIKSSGIWRNG
jgi:hypothetical protein